MIGDKIKQLRIEHNILQKSLANQLNLSQQTISLYEAGKREPDYETLINIADFFNVSTDYLLRKDHTDKTIFTINQESHEPITDLKKHINILLSQPKVVLDGKVLNDESRFLLNNSFSNSIELVRSFEKYREKASK